jgi:hypothetical protein
VTTSSRFFIAIGVTEVIGSTPSTVHLLQLLDERQDAVELVLQMLDFILGNRDTRQMRDAADGCGIDGHANLWSGKALAEAPAAPQWRALRPRTILLARQTRPCRLSRAGAPPI